MKKLRFTINALAILVFTLAFVSIAQAQATRTWVSGVGDDVNPCSRTAPCKTFAGAISKTADGGEIDCLDPGGFGAVTITKSMTIDGAGTMGSILASLTSGVTVNDSGSGAPNTKIVNIRNLSIQGTGPTGANPGLNGVRMISGKSLTVENCIINGFTSVSGVAGIDVNMTNATATEVYVRNTTIQNCRNGIRLTQPSGFLVANITGVNIGHTITDGIQVQANSIADIRDTTIANCPGTGINYTGAANANLGMNIVNSMITHCGVAGIAVGGSTSRITHSAVIQNTVGVSFGGGSLRSFGDNVYDQGTNFSGGAISPQGQQ